MALVSRGFRGRRRQPGAGLVPPGQYLVDDFPVRSGPSRNESPSTGVTLTVAHRSTATGAFSAKTAPPIAAFAGRL